MIRKLVPYIIGANCLLWLFLLFYSLSLIPIDIRFGNTPCQTETTIIK